MPEAGDHRQTHSGRLPTSVRTTSPRPTPRAAQVSRERAPRLAATSPNVHSPPAPVAGQLHERAAAWRRCADDVAGEVHAAMRRYPGGMAVETTSYTEQTDEQQAIIEMVRQFADEQILPNAEHYDHEDEFPEPIVEQMKELGLFGVTIPEEYGGMGLDLTTYVMIVEELSRGWISISGVINTHFIGTYLLQKFGTEEQKQKYLPRMATGEIRAAFSLSEPELGSDVQAIKTSRQEGRRRHLRDQRPEDVGHQRPAVVARLRARQDRPGRRAAPQGLHLLHRREGAGRRARTPASTPASPSRRRSRSSATRASSRPSWSSTATAARPRTSSAARRRASTRASRR